MSQTSTVILIIAIIVVLGSIAYTIQSIEERKRARKLKVLTLKGKIRNAMNIYKGIPDDFMTTELHDFLRKYINSKFQKLHAIDTTQDSQRAFNAFQERTKNRVLKYRTATGSMTVFKDEGQVYHALGKFKELSKWLADLKKDKQIAEATFNELSWQSKDFYDHVSCDIEVLKAIETEKLHGEKAGYHKYNIALKSLGQLNQSEVLDSQIFTIHNHVETLKAIFEAQEALEEEQRRIEQEENEDQANT